jgi:hypothetical protein
MNFSGTGLLILASLRIKLLGDEGHKEKRGPSPTTVEWMIFCYVASNKHILSSIRPVRSLICLFKS